MGVFTEISQERSSGNHMKSGTIFAEILEARYGLGARLDFVEKDKRLAICNFLLRIALQFHHNASDIEIVLEDGLQGSISFEIEIRQIFKKMVPKILDCVGFSALTHPGHHQRLTPRLRHPF